MKCIARPVCSLQPVATSEHYTILAYASCPSREKTRIRLLAIVPLLAAGIALGVPRAAAATVCNTEEA